MFYLKKINFTNKLKFNKSNAKNNSLTVKYFSIFKISPLSTKRKGWST